MSSSLIFADNRRSHIPISNTNQTKALIAERLKSLLDLLLYRSHIHFISPGSLRR